MTPQVHGDLKPANVLLKTHRLDRRGYIAKVADFGARCRPAPRSAGDPFELVPLAAATAGIAIAQGAAHSPLPRGLTINWLSAWVALHIRKTCILILQNLYLDRICRHDPRADKHRVGTADWTWEWAASY